MKKGMPGWFWPAVAISGLLVFFTAPRALKLEKR